MHRNKSVDVHQFAMVPRADIPRSSFRIQKSYKTTFDSGYLVPIYVDEVLPGDTFNLNMTAFARLATPIFPVMDNLYLDSFFFFVPNRLVWANWQKFMGQQDNPGDSISFTIPQVTSPVGGWAIGSLHDYMGLPTVGQVGAGNTVTHSALPPRAYTLIWNTWFRDENLQNSATFGTSDGPDGSGTYILRRRGKRHDYFTSALPFVQKGTAVGVPLTGTAPVTPVTPGTSAPTFFHDSISGIRAVSGSANMQWTVNPGANVATVPWQATGLQVDLAGSSVNALVNQMRQSFQIQKLLERDARGGTRYTEIVRSHFGVISPDARLQRPEYLGGGSSPINISPIPQTSATGVSGGATPLANLGAIGQGLARSGFTQSFTEHGYVIGLVSVRADLTYQQGLRRHWSRLTRYDYYFPAFAMLGEQAILNKEIFADGSVNDDAVFGYQERWAEYRYNPSEITGLFRSTAASTIDPWHLAQRFTALPSLNATFIQDTPPVQRIVAVGAAAAGKEFLLDVFFDSKAARPLPIYSVPGLIDHF